jgi:hypothetical protein
MFLPNNQASGSTPRKYLKTGSKKRTNSIKKTSAKGKKYKTNSAKNTGEGSGRKRCEIYKFFTNESARTKQKIESISESDWQDMATKRAKLDAVIGNGLFSVFDYGLDSEVDDAMEVEIVALDVEDSSKQLVKTPQVKKIEVDLVDDEADQGIVEIQSK